MDNIEKLFEKQFLLTKELFLLIKKELKDEILNDINGNKLLTEKQACQEFNVSRFLLFRLRQNGDLIPDVDRPIRYKYTTVKGVLENHHNTKNSYTRLT